jgi:hypothetical protein
MSFPEDLFTKKFLVFVSFWLTTQYISCTTYGKDYMAAFNSLSKEDYDLCTFPNAYLNMTIWSFGHILLGAFVYYMYILVNEAITPILIMIFCIYGCWDTCPVLMTQNGWKYIHLWLWDALVTGVFGIFITLYLVKYYYKILEKYYILFIFTSIISYCILFYHWFKISKTGCSNWLVKLGDYLHIDKLVESIRIPINSIKLFPM